MLRSRIFFRTIRRQNGERKAAAWAGLMGWGAEERARTSVRQRVTKEIGGDRPALPLG